MTHSLKKAPIIIIGLVIAMSCIYASMGATSSSAAENDIASGIYDNVPWRITSNHELLIGNDGKEYTFSYRKERDESSYPWAKYADYQAPGSNETAGIIKVAFLGKVNGNGSCAWMFFRLTQCKFFELSNFNTEKVSDMSRMFYWCKSIENIDVSSFDTSNVIDMWGMFCSCEKLKKVSLGSWDARKVVNMDNLFAGSENLEEVDLSSIKIHNVEEMMYMFGDCKSLKRIKMPKGTLPRLSYIDRAFYECESLEELDLSGWDTQTALSNDILEPEGFNELFYNCISLNEVALGSRTILPTDFPSPNWIRYKNLSGEPVVGPSFSNVNEYDGDDPGWYHLGVDTRSEQVMSVKVTNKSVKYSKKKSQKVSPITVKSAQGTVTFKKLSGSVKITINEKNGKVTIKKGTKKGTYRMEVKVKAAGNEGFKNCAKTVKVKIKVK